ncbi:alkaline phosphatase family protein [Desulfotomaculum sp. 1211_IL3151]|uniref:alkaline phosphatase family protein n=1 Tax=Desulfotomaculum sp. 1211_IL3151 TaxID=3084055 RepID=UPI002FD9CCF6
MYQKRASILVMAILVWFAFSTQTMAEESITKQENEKYSKVTSKIFMIVADGLQDETLQKTSAPNINGLATTGIRASKVISVFPDTRQAAVASILTGMLPDKHKFIQAGDILEGKSIQAFMEEKQINTCFYGAEGDIKHLLAEGGHNCIGPFDSKDELVIDNLLNEWTEEQSYMNIILLPELRESYKKYGVNSNEYKMAVTKTDAQIGRLLKKLHDENIYDSSMIVLCGTLGAPPLIMKGLPFKSGGTIPPISICDVTPTIAYLNGVKLDKNDGLVLWNAFNETTGQSGEYMLQERIKDLSQANTHLQEEMTRLQEEKLRVKSEQEIVAREKEDIQEQIAERDQKIESLKNRIDMYHIFALIIIGAVGVGYLVLYKLLKKRFLMF